MLRLRVIYLALVASVFGFNVISRARNHSRRRAERRRRVNRFEHQALLFADDEPHLFAERNRRGCGPAIRTSIIWIFASIA